MIGERKGEAWEVREMVIMMRRGCELVGYTKVMGLNRRDSGRNCMLL